MAEVDTSNLSMQEQEMLAYLEDLQQSNPAEYDLLVQQMQEQRQASGKAAGGAGAGQEGEQVVPTPGFVAKTVSATKKGQKVFINVCHSDHVDPPAPMEEAATAADEVQYRIPLSLGPPREDLDKDGAVCTVYDVVFHPEAVENSLKTQEFRDFVMSLTLHQIEQKFKDELSSEIKFPKVKGNYKGVAPLPQFMRKKGSPPPRVEPAGMSTPSEEGQKAEGQKPSPSTGKIQELPSDEAAPEQLPAPAYAVEPRTLRELGGEGGVGASAAEGGAAQDGLGGKVHFPLVSHADEIEVRLSAESLELLAAGKYALCIQLPQPVLTTPHSVRFEAHRQILSVSLRVAPAASASAATLDGAPQSLDAPAAEAEAAVEREGFEGEMVRRAREKSAREKARVRRAAARQAVASGDAPSVGVGTSAAGGEKAAVVEEEARIVEVDGEGDGAARGEDTADGAADGTVSVAQGGTRDKGHDKGTKKRSMLLEISNSIIDEIED